MRWLLLLLVMRPVFGLAFDPYTCAVHAYFPDGSEAYGSGLVIEDRDDGQYVLTAMHVVRGSSWVTVERYGVTVVAQARFGCDDADLSLLRLQQTLTDTSPHFGWNTEPELLQEARCVWWNSGLRATEMTISRLHYNVSIYDPPVVRVFENLLAFNSLTQPGSSGATVFDLQDRILGVISAGRPGETVAIPARRVRWFMQAAMD